MKERVHTTEDSGIDSQDNHDSPPLEMTPGVEVRTRSNGSVIVVGAGVTGLTTAWKLAAAGRRVVVFEARRHVGGMGTTFRHKDLLLDQGPHKFFSVMEDRMRLAEEIVGAEDFLVVPKKSRIRLAGRFLNYPIRFMDIVRNLNPWIALGGAVSYFLQLARNVIDRHPDISYEDWLVRRFGRKLYELIFAAYARKIWGDPKTLARELAETRVAIPGLLSLIWKMLVSRGKGPPIHAETFRYPRLGTGEFSCRLAEKVVQCGGRIHCGVPLIEVVLLEGRVASIRCAGGEAIRVEPKGVVVTTIPVGYLVQLIQPAPPETVLQAAKRLRTQHLILLYIILNRPSVSQDSWLFFPESQYIFTRVFEQKNFSASMVPADKTSLCLEIVAVNDDLWRAADAELFERAIAGLEEAGLVKPSEVLEYFTRRLKWIYPIYDVDYKKNTNVVLNYLDSIPNLYSVGRQGGFNYVGQIDCLDIGILTAEHILSEDNKARWPEARHHFDQYIVLD
jgi:protoporphyrinogen oxidase